MKFATVKKLHMILATGNGVLFSIKDAMCAMTRDTRMRKYK